MMHMNYSQELVLKLFNVSLRNGEYIQMQRRKDNSFPYADLSQERVPDHMLLCSGC